MFWLRVRGFFLKKIAAGIHITVPRIASKRSNFVISLLPSDALLQFFSSSTNIVGITNPIPPHVVDIIFSNDVTKVRCFSFHQIDEILADVLNKIGYAIAENIDPRTINPNEELASTLVHAPRRVKIEAPIIANYIFFPIIKFEGILSKIFETTNDNEHIVISVSLIL